MIRRFCQQLCLITSVFAIACGGGGNTDSPSAATTTTATPTKNSPVSQTEVQIAQSLYSDSARTPPGFYAEATPTGVTVATTHIKSADIASASNGPLYEVCANDQAQAYSWADQMKQAGSSFGKIQVIAMNDRYFQFTRQRTTQPAGIWQQRVYRCDYLDRGSVDLRTAFTHAGHLNRRPVTAESLRELTEYLWGFTPYNNYGNVVLQTLSSNAGTGPKHTLYMATLAVNAGANGCDRITVQAWSYSADALNGELTLANLVLWQFDAKQSGGLAEVCATPSTQ